MKRDVAQTTLLVIVAILLALNLAVPVLRTPPSYAGGTFQYRIVDAPVFINKWETELNKYGQEGWELIDFGPKWIFKKSS